MRAIHSLKGQELDKSDIDSQFQAMLTHGLKGESGGKPQNPKTLKLKT